MKKAAVLALLAFTSCQSATPTANRSEPGFVPVAEAKTDLLQVSKPPEWSHFCSFETKDAFGDNTYKKHCTLSVTNVGSLIGLSYPMFMDPVVTVTEDGIEVVRPEPKSTCSGRGPSRMSIDQHRIDGQTTHTQIEALKVGYIFTREEQANWPYCGIAPHATYLYGFSGAYEAMMREWERRDAR